MDRDTQQGITFLLLIYVLVAMFVFILGTNPGEVKPEYIRHAVLWPLYIVRAIIWCIMKVMDSVLFPNGFLQCVRLF